MNVASRTFCLGLWIVFSPMKSFCRNYDHERLDQLFRRSDKSGHHLKAVHEAKFNVSLKDKEFNSKQVFVVLTNGLDFRTREAIQYWVLAGLEVRAWVYRIYRYT